MNVDYIGHYGDDLLVVNAARVSMNKWHYNFNEIDDKKLINYLARNQHISPFFHPVATFRIVAPIFVARQLMRSTVGLAISETSRRYVSDRPNIYRPQEWRSRAESIKQGSGPSIDDQDQLDFVTEAYLDAVDAANAAYSMLLLKGVSPEQARMVLPVSMETSWIWTGSLYAFYRVCSLRLDNHSQKETQQIAVGINSHMSKLYPVSWQALSDNDPIKTSHKIQKLKKLNIPEVVEIIGE